MRSIWRLFAAGAAALALVAASAAAATASTGSTPGVQRACSASAGPNYAQCLVLVRTGVATHKGVARDVTPVGYGPSNLQAAYNLTLAAAASGKGQTVAIVDAYDDPDAESDLGVYRAQYGLPPCTTANGCFDKVNQEGEAGPLPAAAGTTGWATEESLDLDMVSAICPNCHILLVEADNNLFDNMGAGVDSAVALGSQFVSNSYAGPEASGDTAYTAYYDHPGVAVTVAAGDSGYGVEFPAASPYVTAVGGTELIADKAAARGWAEQVWGNGTSGTDGDGTGSGCSAYEAKPSWQADTGCGNRTVADVAADADPYTGAAVYDSYDQTGWLEVGGTSEATPIIAATYALAGAPGAGDDPAEYPYEHTGELNDVVAGSNGSCSPVYLCNGEPGYNGPAGNGTPDGTGAFRAADNTVTVTSPGAQSSTKGEPIAPLTVTAADSDPSQALTWSATGLPGGLSINSVTGVISGKPTAAATSTVTVNTTDNTGATGLATFTWQVTSNAITVASPGTQTAMTGRNVTPLTITATDSDPGQALSYTATGLPRGLSISPAGVISGTPTRLQYSTVTITATDATGASGSVKFTWRVDSEGAIRSGMSSGRCIADRSGKIEIEHCDGAGSQRWLITAASNGTVTVSLARATGTCITVNRSRTASGTKVVASRCVITSSQRWKDASGGHLTGKHSGKCLTDPGAGRNGTQLEIAACKATAAEDWNLP